MTKVNLSVNVGGLVMKNPVTVASGTFGSGREYSEFWETCRLKRETSHTVAEQCDVSNEQLPGTNLLSALGAITTKGVSLEPWDGNPTPRIAETASGMLNSIGLQNKGVETFCKEDLAWLATHAPEVPVIVNVFGHTVDSFVPVIERLEQEPGVSAYEINISCPNLESGGMAFGVVHPLAAAVTRACRDATARPLIVKLTPNVTDITVIARAVEAAGADALSLINTVAGMAIDSRTRKSVLARGVGGLSGPAIKPIALLALYRCYQTVRIPLIGMGGIQNVTDAIEFFLAGATAIAIGTANFVTPLISLNMAHDIEQWCLEAGITDIKELIGGLEL